MLFGVPYHSDNNNSSSSSSSDNDVLDPRSCDDATDADPFILDINPVPIGSAAFDIPCVPEVWSRKQTARRRKLRGAYDERATQDQVLCVMQISLIGICAIHMSLVISWHFYLLLEQSGVMFSVEPSPALSPVIGIALGCARELCVIAGPHLLILGALNFLRERSYGKLVVTGSCLVAVEGCLALVYDALLDPLLLAPGCPFGVC